MSSRINRLMGWGMPWSKFEEISTLDGGINLNNDTLNNAFRNAGHEGLTIPEDVMKASWGTHSGRLSILSVHLTTTKFVQNRATPAPEAYGRPEDLYSIVFNGDDATDIVFLPALYFKWRHHDDDLDYAFEQWRRTFMADFSDPDHHYSDTSLRGQQDSPRDRVLYLPYGPYPYTNSLMHAETGEPVKWEHFTIVEKHPEWVPDVPPEIRWYLPKLGILDEAGVNQLRPCIAQWWS